MTDLVLERFSSDDFAPSVKLNGGQLRELGRVVAEEIASDASLSGVVGLAEIGGGYVAIRFYDRNSGEPSSTKRLLMPLYGDQ